MKKTKLTRSLLAACSIVALSVVLSGCLHSGSDDTASTTDPTTPTEPPPPSNLTALFGAAQDASSDAAMAGEDAMAAEMAATDAAMMLTTTEVAGDSKKAMMNAQAILDARGDAAQAVMDAEAALAAAKKAEMDAMDVADDHPQKAALDAAIAAAIKAAEDQVKAATAVRDGTKLRNAVAEVEGTNKKGTPRSVANMVGEDIAGALARHATNARTGTRTPAHATEVTAGTADALKHEANDAQGMTWAMIVGEDNVMKMRLGTIDATGALTAGNAEVSVASLAGMTATDVTSTTLTDGTIDADGGTTAGSYMGIVGAVICLGGSDGCKVTDGKLGAGWYFSPASPMAFYQRMMDNPATDTDESQTYEAETLYAMYGYWLSVDTSDPPLWSVHTYSAAATGAATGYDVAANDDLAESATYSGSAAGMSSRTMGSGDSKTTDSGMFTADVTLTATFGGTPVVEGTINNFRGDAVGSGWSVKLHSATLATGGTATTGGVATGGGHSGDWSNQAYGAANARPTGIHGGFVAHFADGDAAGAYATRADDQ